MLCMLATLILALPVFRPARLSSDPVLTTGRSSDDTLAAYQIEDVDHFLCMLRQFIERPRPETGGRRVSTYWLESLSFTECTWRFR
jgi:hypothetical protein